jgi:hypothetical protein
MQIRQTEEGEQTGGEVSMRRTNGHPGRVFSGGLVALILLLACCAGTANAAMTIEGFGGSVLDEAGQPEHQAGAHPFEADTRFSFPMDAEGLSEEDLKTSVVHLPPGFVGNPLAAPRCEIGRTVNIAFPANLCPASSQVGTVSIGLKEGLVLPDLPVYNLEPPPGVPARFGFNVIFPDVFVEARLRPGDYGIDVIARDANQALNVTSVDFNLWGVPASSAHDEKRIGFGCGDILVGTPCAAGVPPKPFITTPMDCSAGALTTTLEVDSWQTQGVFDRADFDHDDSFTPPEPMNVEGCEALDFEPELSVRPTSAAAASPTGLSVELTVPFSDDPDGLAVPPVKRVEVVLPEGTAVNPSSAGGLGSCGPAQVGLGKDSPAACPDSSKIGTVEVATPLVDHPLQGTVYLARQGDNPFGSLLALYLAIEDEQSGVVVKLAGRVQPDPENGQLRTVFDHNPQLPFETMRIRLVGGDRAPLTTPERCGTYTTAYEITSWAGQAVAGSDAFTVDRGPGGEPCPTAAFEPELSAGTANPIAGAYSPFVLRLTRRDGTQRLATVTTTLPEGLLGRLRHIAYCPEAALAGISDAAGSGVAELSVPGCPPASQVGTVSAGAGAGPTPFFVDTSRVYLAGPYAGAPLSLAVVTPAVAGPFDLGSVVVRAALRVDPASARITAVSDPLPSILHGIPLNLRDIRVSLDRPGFTLNPTSCEPMAIASTITSVGGAAATPAVRFQAANCERLPFEPKLSLRLKGATRRTGHPQLTAVLTQKPGGSNIARASVAMPGSELLAQDHIRTVCTRVQFAAEACPKGSVYGRARAFSPLLDRPLEGPVYLRSSNNPLPDLVADLRGQIDIELAGRIDSKNGGIRTTFDTVPDAPVTRFVLEMHGGKRSLLENSENLCASENRATVKMDAHNGKVRDFRPLVRASCGRGGQR